MMFCMLISFHKSIDISKSFDKVVLGRINFSTGRGNNAPANLENNKNNLCPKKIVSK